MRLVDLSMPLQPGVEAFPGDCCFEHNWRGRISSNGEGANVSTVTLSLHFGTHVDAPWHFLANGAKLDELPLDKFCGPAVCLDIPKQPGEHICAEDLQKANISQDDIVLIRTGWEIRAFTPAYFGEAWPGFDPTAVEFLVSKGVKAIGADIPSTDSMANLGVGAPAHMASLGANLVLFECLINLDKVAGRRFTFWGLPLNLTAVEASPVRAIAALDE